MRAREKEVAKYVYTYRTHERYAMGGARKFEAQDAVAQAFEPGGGYLDVGCGRGEMLEWAKLEGYAPVAGLEAVPALCNQDVTLGYVHELPWKAGAFDVVTCFDVLEHLVPGDDVACLHEIARVASRGVVLTANNLPSRNHNGDNLHINIRPYDEWDEMVRAAFDGWTVERRPGYSELWIASTS